jgi:hypothetical protein
MTNLMREEWLRARKLPLTTLWYPYDGCSDYSSGAGDLAESSSWTFQGPDAGFLSKLGPPPNEEQQELIRKWFSQVAGK